MKTIELLEKGLLSSNPELHSEALAMQFRNIFILSLSKIPVANCVSIMFEPCHALTDEPVIFPDLLMMNITFGAVEIPSLCSDFDIPYR